MTETEISALTEKQRSFFASGATLGFERRAAALSALYTSLKSHERELLDALNADLGKSAQEAYMCEVGMTLSAISYLRRHLKRLMRVRRTRAGLAQFPGHGELRSAPYGVCLIISPWNYPVLLALEPLANAVAAGNTVVLKPSASSGECARVIASIVRECFPEEYVCVVTGSREENDALLKVRWDKIFFTGSAATGRKVLRAAAENLTPVTLELGGKSPVIVDCTANIDLAAKRIVYGKFLNCGQTCVAPDYVLCDAKIHGELVAALVRETRAQFPDPLHDPTYGKMINERRFDSVLTLIDGEKVVLGGKSDRAALKIEPTVMDGVLPGDAVMDGEIFGPVLPVLTYETLKDAADFVEARPRPLALYLFTESRANKEYILGRCRFGGGCVNDTIMHLTAHSLPFGGMGESGMGRYHGKYGFEEFSHLEGVLCRGTYCDPGIRYRPYSARKLGIVRRFMS